MGSDYILGAVGILQFDVTMERLKTEYSVDAIYEPINYSTARWVACDDRKKLDAFKSKYQSSLALDAEGHLSYLADSNWRLERTMELCPDITFLKTREYS